MIVFAYLAAIVAANLSIARFGPGAAPVNAFLFIGFDLVARDRLHDNWQGAGLLWKMGALILAGGVLTYALNGAAGRIAMASTIAFSIAAIGDGILYHLLRRRGWYVRSNGSNVAGAILDSALFLPLAFGVFPWAAMAGQLVAKVAGGALWSAVIDRVR